MFGWPTRDSLVVSRSAQTFVEAAQHAGSSKLSDPDETDSVMSEAREIAFGQFRLDLANECLWRGTRAISLRPKAFAVLKLLVDNPGLLVTKQRVLDTVWPGTFVGDAVLKDNIRQLREALEDDAGSPTYIETAHRRGYRFIGKLSDQTPSKNPNVAAQMLVSQLQPDFTPFTSLATPGTVLGRDAELLQMRRWLERSLTGERQTIFITGEPGIGKTTILQKFLEQAAQVPDLRVARGQCLEHYGAGEPYLPVLEGFSRLCRSPQGAEVLDVLRQHAPAWLVQMPSLIPQSERQDLQAHVAAPRERMLREMADAIESLASESPFLLVLEDLHWSDYSTLDLVSYLARRRDPVHLMVIGTYRPVDVIVGDHPLKGVKRELQAHGLSHELPLEYLSTGAIEQYLAARFPGHEFPLRLGRTICQRTEGNPLFMVSLVEYLVDEKVIVNEGGTWKVDAACSEKEQGIPTNVRQLIEKEIERLSPDERTVLEAASVAGMECSSAVIAAGLEMPTEWVEKHCDELARRHRFLSPAWLVELPNGIVTPRHRFIHILYRDVPYRLIPAMRRSQIHQRIAERGVAIYGERSTEIAAELAMHFEQSRDWPHALEHLLTAADNAMTRSAHHEASDLAKRGLEVIESLPRASVHPKHEMKLRMILSVSLMAIKGFASEEVESINAPGRELFWRQGPSPELFYMLWSFGLYYQFSGQLHSALEISSQLLQLAGDLNDGALLMEAHRAMGGALVELGRCTEALQHLDAGTALYATHRQHPYAVFMGRDCRVVCECLAARALWALGYPERAAERIASALSLARDVAHPQTLMVVGHFAVQLHQLRGEPRAAQQHARAVVKLADEYGLEVWACFGHIDLAWSEAELGDVQRGIAQMKRSLEAYEATGARLRSPYFLGLLADELGKAGRVEEGLIAIAQAVILAERNGESYWLSELYRIKGELLIKISGLKQAGKLPNSARSTALSQARACFADALAIAKQQGTKSWELRAALCMYRLDLMLGNPNHTQLAEVYSSFIEGFETADLKQACALLNSSALA
jgi:DNA-binding winged helix-turn-helix (wHTH) protein/predicted ATPase